MGTLTHPPADIVHSLIVDSLSLMSDPTGNGSWPLFVAHEPDSPDNCGTIYDTGGINEPKQMSNGLVTTHHGLQIRMRGLVYDTAWSKLNAIVVALNAVSNSTLTYDSVDYVVRSFTQVNSITSLGKEVDNTKRRDLFAVNYIVTLDTN